MNKLLCRLLGHRMNATSITGQYRWCSRCAKREAVGTDDEVIADFNRRVAERWPAIEGRLTGGGI